MTILVFNSNNLVNCSKCWLVISSDEFSTYTPDVNLSFLHLEVKDGIFIKIIGCIDLSIRKSCFIQLLTNFFRNIGNVSRVNADTKEIVAKKY